MRTTWKTLAWLAPLLFATLATAQKNEGQAFGFVTDGSTGKVLKGVEMTVVDPGLGDRVVCEQKTDRMGRYTCTLADATRPLVFRLSKDGYLTIREQVQLEAGGGQQLDWAMKPGQDPPAPPASEPGKPKEKSPEEKRRERKLAVTADAASLYNAGVEAFQVGDTVTAQENFEQALERDPDLAPAHAALGAISLQDGETETALEHADRALALEPENSLALEAKYKAHQLLGQTAEAEQTRGAFLAAAPEAAVNLLLAEGTEAFQAGDTESAIIVLSQVVEVNPDLADAQFTLGMAYAKSENDAKAVEHLQRFLSLVPTDHPDAASTRDMITHLERDS